LPTPSREPSRPDLAAAADGDLPRRGAFFGRRKGKALRAHQAGLLVDRLPSFRLDVSTPGRDPREAFAPGLRHIHLEVGFGGGEHLAQRAAESPDVGFIGCEAFVNGVAKLMALVERDRLDNIRIFDDDAEHVLSWLPDSSIGRAYVLYPDPWPKRRHRKRRFLGSAMLAAFARVLRPGAELRFATDIDDYAGYVLARAARTPGLAWTAERAADWQRPWEGWRSTRYEAKALREGRVPAYFTFARE
jgi:tRNA (guanine-N7-)-methyltransferase